MKTIRKDSFKLNKGGFVDATIGWSQPVVDAPLSEERARNLKTTKKNLQNVNKLLTESQRSRW